MRPCSFLPPVARSRRLFSFIIVPAIVIAKQNLRLQRFIAKMTVAIRQQHMPAAHGGQPGGNGCKNSAVSDIGVVAHGLFPRG